MIYETQVVIIYITHDTLLALNFHFEQVIDLPGFTARLSRFISFPYFFKRTLRLKWALLVAQMVKHLPAMQETWVQFLGWEDLLEKEMATHFSTLAWRIPWMEEPDCRLQSMG